MIDKKFDISRENSYKKAVSRPGGGSAKTAGGKGKGSVQYNCESSTGNVEGADKKEKKPVAVRDQIYQSLKRYPRLFDRVEKGKKYLIKESEKDEFFGNQKDYQPLLGDGIGGYYREPMDEGKGIFFEMLSQPDLWNIPQSYRDSQRFNQDNIEGLSMRQPGWNERFEELEKHYQKQRRGILTLREDKELSKTLNPEYIWGREETIRESIYGKIAIAWHHLMEDLKRGQERYRFKKREVLRERKLREREKRAKNREKV